MLPHHDLSTGRDTGMELQSYNHQQRRLYANPSPERDSLFEELQYLRTKYAITDEDILPAFTYLRQGMEFNDLELHGERELTGLLDDLASTAHRMVRNPTGPTLRTSIKDLANRLRPHLQILVSPAGHTARDIDQARAAVRRIAATETHGRLTSPTLVHELRPTCHNELLRYVEPRS